MNYKFLEDLNLSREVINNISLLLKGVEEGNDVIIRSPFANDDVEANKILKNWISEFESKQHLLNEELINLESLNRSKFGPRSIAVPWSDRKEALYAYFKGKQNKSINVNARKLEVHGGLRPFGWDQAMSFLKNNTNSGLPFYTRKGKVKDKVLQNLTVLSQRRDPCIMFTRTQESLKTRTVWGYPMYDTLAEMRYYQPLLKVQKKTPWRSALLGPIEVDKHITKLIDRCIKENKELVSIDFGSYDATVKRPLQKDAFNYIKRMFQSKYHKEIDDIFERFNTIGIITPDGVVQGQHGVPSGSTFTNEVDSLAQYLIAVTSNIDIGDDFQIQGDDGAYGTDKPEELKDKFRSHGLSVSDDKTYVSMRFLVYLQMLYSIDYRNEEGIIGGIYPTFRALNRIIYQERFTNFMDYEISGNDYYSIRTISILENCKNHPLFEELVKFVWSLDRNKLNPSDNGITNYVKMIRDKSGIEGIIANQYGDDLRGIANFKTVKIISRLNTGGN